MQETEAGELVLEPNSSGPAWATQRDLSTPPPQINNRRRIGRKKEEEGKEEKR